jgi:TatD DNase family protein
MIDICVNFFNRQLQADPMGVLTRAEACGIKGIVLCATDLAMVADNIALCTDPIAGINLQYRTTAGVHPHDACTWHSSSQAQLMEFARNPYVCAIGECGLDFNRNFSTQEAQIFAFQEQIEVAIEVNKPLFVHDRESQGQVLKLLTLSKLPPTVIHCFTGSEEELKGYIEAGFYIGITGWICDQKRGGDLRALVKQIPLDKLLVETDAPFLRPQNAPLDFASTHSISAKWKKRNEPALLGWVIEEIAKQRQESVAQITKASSSNAKLLFGFT